MLVSPLPSTAHVFICLRIKHIDTIYTVLSSSLADTKATTKPQPSNLTLHPLLPTLTLLSHLRRFYLCHPTPSAYGHTGASDSKAWVVVALFRVKQAFDLPPTCRCYSSSIWLATGFLRGKHHLQRPPQQLLHPPQHRTDTIQPLPRPTTQSSSCLFLPPARSTPKPLVPTPPSLSPCYTPHPLTLDWLFYSKAPFCQRRHRHRFLSFFLRTVTYVNSWCPACWIWFIFQSAESKSLSLTVTAVINIVIL